MINLKILSAAAMMALTLPVIGATESYAQGRGGHGGGGFHGGGGGFHGGGGGFRGGFGGGPRFGGGGGWHRGGGWGRGGGGLVAGALIGGALASGAYGYGNGYYGGGPYYGGYGSYGYYDAPIADDGDEVEVAPEGGGDVNYCIQTYKSYNVRTGTYLGYDGLRHSCP
jgi:hypothetical protein